MQYLRDGWGGVHLPFVGCGAKQRPGVRTVKFRRADQPVQHPRGLVPVEAPCDTRREHVTELPAVALGALLPRQISPDRAESPEVPDRRKLLGFYLHRRPLGARSAEE